MLNHQSRKTGRAGWRVAVGFLLIAMVGLGWWSRPGWRWLMSGEKTVWVLLQNSDELRGTGGFIGSYATLKVNGLQWYDWQIEDIYQPTGQIAPEQKPLAPLAVQKYLNNGAVEWNLPDLNWASDWPTVAQLLIPQLQAGKVGGEPDLVIAVNLTGAEEVLRVLGPIYLPDYQVAVDQDNLAAVARADREQFFPGSHQKRNFLQHFYGQLQGRLDKLTGAEKWALIGVARKSLEDKDVQIWAREARLARRLQEWGWAGQLNPPTEAEVARGQFYLQSIESNVGINKANAGISRATQITIADHQLQLRTVMENHHQYQADEKNRLHYSNYQRFLLDPQVQVQAISWQDQAITDWQEAIVVTADGQVLKEIGFLLQLPEQTRGELRATFTAPQQITSVRWEKQAGNDNPLNY